MTSPEQDPDAVPGEPEAARQRYLRDKATNNRRTIELTIFIFILFSISIFWTSHTASRVTAASEAVIAKACDFWYPLTSLPVTIVPPAQKPTKLSVSIITGARESYAGQCSPPHPVMPPPDPSLVKWARVYGIPVADP